jgi:hypothetical protein
MLSAQSQQCCYWIGRSRIIAGQMTPSELHTPQRRSSNANSLSWLVLAELANFGVRILPARHIEQGCARAEKPSAWVPARIRERRRAQRLSLDFPVVAVLFIFGRNRSRPDYMRSRCGALR